MITPVDKYKWIAGILRYFLNVCGSNFMDGEFRIPFRGQFYLSLMLIGISSAIYTIITAEVGFAMQAIVFCCLAIQVMIRCVNNI